MFLPLFWGVLCFDVCFVMHYLASFLALQSSCREKKRATCFTLTVFLVSYDCLWSLALPHGAVGWAAVCECDISWSYSLFCKGMLNFKSTKGHILKSNFGSDNCFACMHRMVCIKFTTEIANFPNSITEAEKLYWTLQIHVYSLHKNGLGKKEGWPICTLCRRNSFQSDFHNKPILSPPVANPGLAQLGSKL